MRDKISACVITYNEEDKIERSLRSLQWCDEIIVVDSYSTDRTVEICKRYTERVYQHKWLGYIGQKNLIRQMAQFPWVLFLDADEEVAPELRDEILDEFETGPENFVAYRFPRQVYYLGSWIRHGDWYPDIKLRLFRKDAGRSGGREPHDQVIVSGPVKTLRSPIYHYTYDSIFDHVNTINHFSTITAQEKFKEGFRCNLADLVLRPWWRFIKCYFLYHSFLDGRRGYFIAMMNMYGVVMKYAKLWECELQKKQHIRFPTDETGDGPDKPS